MPASMASCRAGGVNVTAGKGAALSVVSQDGITLVRPSGAWIAEEGGHIDSLARNAAASSGGGVVEFDLAGVDRLDSAGAWVLERTRRALELKGANASFREGGGRHAPLLKLVEQACKDTPEGPRPEPLALIRILNAWGAKVFDAGAEAKSLLNFLGLVTLAAMRVAINPRRMRPKAFVTHMEQAGLDAIPIVGLLAFLIGVVLAYQGSDQLRQFGAEIFTVNLLGVSVLRVLGVLITAILIAGRSGSAFTAEIGSMQVREEIDAMRALGLDPVEVLVLPRMMALIVVLPLLAFFANVMAMTGGAIMAYVTLDITPGQFLTQLNNAISLNTFVVGLVQAPVFAALIALVGCFEGFRVERSAESVGRQTTRSVVESIFLVIVATALFSILFSTLGV